MASSVRVELFRAVRFLAVLYVTWAPAQPLAAATDSVRSDPTGRYVFKSTPEAAAFVLTRASSRGSALSEKKRLPRPSKTGQTTAAPRRPVPARAARTSASNFPRRSGQGRPLT
jgi:hypothetical protein